MFFRRLELYPHQRVLDSVLSDRCSVWCSVRFSILFLKAVPCQTLCGTVHVGWTQARYFFQQLISGLEHCHSQVCP